MTVETPTLTPIADHLSATVASLRAVDTGFDAAAGADKTRTSPSALVMPFAAGYQPNALAGAVRQQRTHIFSVVLFFTGAGANGKAAIEDFELVKNGVLGALVGWQHPLGGTSVEAIAERLLKFDAKRQLAIYEIRFSHKTHVSKLS